MASDEEAAQNIVSLIRATFLAEAVKIDTRMKEDGFDPLQSPYNWIEYFSQQTTDAIKCGDDATAIVHLNLISELQASGDESTSCCIDVAYVESLLWDIDDVVMKSAGWSLIPQNLQVLYIRMWGMQPFMRE